MVTENETGNVQADPRYIESNADDAIGGDVIRGLVELITNCDVSYNSTREAKQGSIRLSVERRRKESVIKVIDEAAGMTLEEMRKKILRIGGLTSGFLETRGEAARGIHGRGAKDCAILGKIKFCSFKDNRYSEVEIDSKFKYKITCPEKDVTDIERVKLDFWSNSGTVVILTIEHPRIKMPTFDKICENLTNYYSLRDICSSANRKIIIISENDQKEKKLHYKTQEGEVVFDEKIEIPEYPEADTHFALKKANHRIEIDKRSPYWEGGVLIKAKHAIHNITSISSKIENNPYFTYYFGRLTCPYIDELATQFEMDRSENQTHSEKNPRQIIEPRRAEGLSKSHPFTKALYKKLEEIVATYLKQDEENATKDVKEIENKKTKERNNKLAKAASRFLRENVELEDDIEDEAYLTATEVPLGGMRVVPEGLQVGINESKTIYIYVRPSSTEFEKHAVALTVSEKVKIQPEIVGLAENENSIYVGSCVVTGIHEGVEEISVQWGSVSKRVRVNITEKRVEHKKIEGFQFEKPNYTLKEGKIKNIRVITQWPEFINGRVKIMISTSDNEKVEIINKNVVVDYYHDWQEFFGRRVGIGTLRVRGIKQGGPIILTTSLQGKEISTKLRVRPAKEFGKEIEIKLVNEDLGEQRAVFDEGKGLIKINGRHENIQRYLGPPDAFLGQNSIHYRLLQAEIVADTIARITLTRKIRKNQSEYQDIDIDSFYRKHREIMSKFLPIAHKIGIADEEIKRINNENSKKD